MFHFSRKCGLLGPEVIGCQPGVVDLQEEVGVFDCDHQDLEGRGQGEGEELLLADQGMGAQERLVGQEWFGGSLAEYALKGDRPRERAG